MLGSNSEVGMGGGLEWSGACSYRVSRVDQGFRPDGGLIDRIVGGRESNTSDGGLLSSACQLGLDIASTETG